MLQRFAGVVEQLDKRMTSLASLTVLVAQGGDSDERRRFPSQREQIHWRLKASPLLRRAFERESQTRGDWEATRRRRSAKLRRFVPNLARDAHVS